MKDKLQKLKRGQLYWLILEVIGLCIVSGGGSPMKPTLPLMLKTIWKILKEIKKIDVEEEKIKRTLMNLEKKEIINLSEQDGEVTVSLKENNNPTVVKYSIKALLDLKKRNDVWNGKWFMVFFDVPELQKNKREYLRKFLNKIGFFKYQKSVYVFPYECEKEVGLIKTIIQGGKYMKYIIADKIEGENELKIYFNL